MSDIVKNTGWWGSPINSEGRGIIMWQKRQFGKLLQKVPEVGDTIVDPVGGKLVGFTVESIDNGSLGSDDYLIKVKADGWYYDED